MVVRYRYIWGPRGNLPGAPNWKGQLCRLLVRGGMNSALVESESGVLAVISRNALRKVKDGKEIFPMILNAPLKERPA